MKRLAELARLRLTGRECDRLTGELNEILALVDRLDDLPEQQPEQQEEEQRGAGAEAKRADPLHRSIAELAPRSEESFFLVPKLPAHDDSGDSEG